MCFSFCAADCFVVVVLVLKVEEEVVVHSVDCEFETRRWTFCDNTQEDLCLLTVVIVGG